MVKILLKKGNETQFLYETSVETENEELTKQITYIYNGRLKVSRICSEMEELAKYGTMLPPDMMGLTDEQIEELKLIDEWGDRCEPSGGSTLNKDPMGRRNGKQPTENMQELIKKSVADVKEMLSKKKAENGICMTLKIVQEALDILRGTIMIIYPMNLPPHDVIRQEFENTEDLTGTQASLDVIDIASAQLWFSGKELLRNKRLCNFVGNNEKTKIVVKISKMGEGAPAREPVVSEEERRQMMLHAYRRQEELKKLEQDDDNVHLDSAWADGRRLKRAFQGLSSDISWRPRPAPH